MDPMGINICMTQNDISTATAILIVIVNGTAGYHNATCHRFMSAFGRVNAGIVTFDDIYPIVIC
jgi:hypothetical protein